MRIAIDMQGAQTESRFRGIGRYTMAFAKAVALNRGRHEIILALNAAFPDTIEPIRAAFEGLLSQDNIRLWHFEGPVREIQSGNDARRSVAERLRESFLASLKPDVVHVSSMFEGYLDDAVTSVGEFDSITPVSVMLYDLIPLLNAGKYLTPNPDYERFYRRKLVGLKKSATLLSISEYAKSEGSQHLSNKIVSISAGVDELFQSYEISEGALDRVLRSHSIKRPYVLYAGGADERKNLGRLVQAYASQSAELRRSYQLVLAGKFPESEVSRLHEIAREHGMRRNELVTTGYVSESDLLSLYKACHLFVLPSFHEGFGLPALEAMACGAPVIAARSSSLPEVVGLEEALFDPFCVDAIARKLSQALLDETFRGRLCRHGPIQAREFTWDRTAKAAIDAWEALAKDRAPAKRNPLANNHLYSALAPFLSAADDCSLIATTAAIYRNYVNGLERQLLVDVSELCQRDAATGVQRVVRSYLKCLMESPPLGFRVEPVYATQSEGYRYARRYASRFLGTGGSGVGDDLIAWQRGDVFFGLDMQHHVQLKHSNFYRQLMGAGVVVKFLVHDLLPIQLEGFFADSGAKALHERWLTMISTTDGAVAVSEATANAFEGWLKDRGIYRAPSFTISWVHSGADFNSLIDSVGVNASASRVLERLRLRPTFLCVSTVEPRKRQAQILGAVELLWGRGVDVNLVFVGRQGWHVDDLAGRLRSHPELDRRLFWLQEIGDEYLGQVYRACTCLISASVNEGFGLPLVEAAQYGIPIFARDIPVFREVANGYADYFHGEEPEDLAQALTAWLAKYRDGTHTRSEGMPWSTWQQSTENLVKTILGKSCPRRQLLVDISELVKRDSKTGIQRVVRNILRHWLLDPPSGWRVEPVYAEVGQGYRYARQFRASFLGVAEASVEDEPIDYQPGDSFVALDLQPQIQVAQRHAFSDMRREGVLVQFVVYDLLAVQMPQYFPPGTEEGFRRWLEVVAESDGALCISRAVAKDLEVWMAKRDQLRIRPFSIAHFPLGADISSVPVSRPMTAAENQTLADIRSRPTFLMVGAIEHRKGHVEVLEAFDWLWREGKDLNLVIAGKPGWMTEPLQARLRAHSALGKRLFWIVDADDAYLENIYAASTCLIAASHGEGFGLPLIEAARNKLPVVARDLSVFREVAGDNAFYFQSVRANGLVNCLLQWCRLYESGIHPRSDHIFLQSWRESAIRLLKLVITTRVTDATKNS